jgi:putative ABC transport system permease protein
MQLAVRTQTEPMAVGATVGQVLRSIDAELPLDNPSSLSSVVGQSLGQPRLLFTLLTLFAVLALTLAAVGIYSVVAYSVTTRTSEIGVRMALGATPRNVLWLIIGQAMKPVLIGGVIGLAACFAMGHFIERQLYGVSASDPTLLAATCVGLVVVAAVASWVPARRATRVDPMVALRFQ